VHSTTLPVRWARNCDLPFCEMCLLPFLHSCKIKMRCVYVGYLRGPSQRRVFTATLSLPLPVNTYPLCTYVRRIPFIPFSTPYLPLKYSGNPGANGVSYRRVNPVKVVG
jgi:hypothetical protein